MSSVLSISNTKRRSLYSYKILFDLRLQCAILTIGTGPYILFYTQSNDNLSTVLSQDEAVLAAN